MLRKNVRMNNGTNSLLKVGSDRKIYLGNRQTGYRIGKDGKIYTNQGRFVSSLPPEEFLRIDGKIK